MKKQDKLFSLLKWNGWERANTPEGVGYRFKNKEWNKDQAYDDCYYMKGVFDTLEIDFLNLWVQKEGTFYVAYIEF